ncbi:MAG TPA: SDR family oxidoreductase [Bellilinea sp.]|nr:SDR family oxidoreductase [Bellilinea sp.]
MKCERLSERRILITGASAGIGRTLALACAEAGAAVAVAARRRDRLEALVAEIAARGGMSIAVEMDVRSDASVSAAFEFAEAKLGAIDGVVANAGIHLPGKALDTPIQQFDEILAVNTRGVFLTLREGARRMIENRVAKGRMLLIASVGGIRVLPNVTAYCVSKAAVIMMGRSLAREWATAGINVNVICPGYVATEINEEWFRSGSGRRLIDKLPRKRLIQAGEIAPIATLLLSDAAETITGSVITVDDGQFE